MPSRKPASTNDKLSSEPLGIRLNAGDRLALYAAQRFIGSSLEEKLNYQEALGASAASLPKFKAFEKQWLNAPQPWRTDCEHALSSAAFVDVEIDA